MFGLRGSCPEGFYGSSCLGSLGACMLKVTYQLSDHWKWKAAHRCWWKKKRECDWQCKVGFSPFYKNEKSLACSQAGELPEVLELWVCDSCYRSQTVMPCPPRAGFLMVLTSRVYIILWIYLMKIWEQVLWNLRCIRWSDVPRGRSQRRALCSWIETWQIKFVKAPSSPCHRKVASKQKFTVSVSEARSWRSRCWQELVPTESCV